MNANIFDKQADLKKELNEVKSLIDKKLSTDQVEFSQIVKNSFNENSKMIRPALALICASYKSANRQQAISLAAAMEMLHVATLIHDDIIDNSDYRRGKEAIQKSHGVGYAVICGDYLFAKSYQMLFENNKAASIKLMGNNVVKMCFGEVEQYYQRHNHTITVEKYLSIIEKKTAAFFESNCVLGAKLANCHKKEVETLKKFGHDLGMIFQIQDDILDFEKSQSQIGKPALSDLNRGNFSLPLIIAMQNDTELADYLSCHEVYDIPYVLDVIEKTQALDKAKAYYQAYMDSIIVHLANVTNDDVRDKLKIVVDVVIERNT